MTKGSEPAFPKTKIVTSATGLWEGPIEYGLTKREWLAGMAMQGMCANADVSQAMSKAHLTPDAVRKSFAFSAVRQADDLLAELEKSADGK